MIFSTFGGSILGFLVASIVSGAGLGFSSLIMRKNIRAEDGASVWKSRPIRANQPYVPAFSELTKLAA